MGHRNPYRPPLRRRSGILPPVEWYLRFSLLYRDVEVLLTERGLPADHVTVWRWASAAPRTGTTFALDSWRVEFDLHPGPGQMGVFIPSRGLQQCAGPLLVAPALGLRGLELPDKLAGSICWQNAS